MKTLIITDVQHDFLPGGSLAVPGGDEVIAVINLILPRFNHVFATQDWHPPQHMSFASTHKKQPSETIWINGMQQILWPDHCIQNTYGAEIAESLNREQIEKIFHKGSSPDVDSYSTFFDNARKRSTGLADHLKKLHLKDLYFVGLATDYCVLYSVLDALDLQFKVWVIRDACRAINLNPRDEEKAFEKMRSHGAKIIESGQI
ncbi:MAG: bifunctional nicotinamidase/pyrazinamidase [Parachlamydiales bacterium]|nr:bifunctional nicotinamidase/pyrazinamidase [Parachlamydiales bacterium]